MSFQPENSLYHQFQFNENQSRQKSKFQDHENLNQTDQLMNMIIQMMMLLMILTIIYDEPNDVTFIVFEDPTEDIVFGNALLKRTPWQPSWLLSQKRTECDRLPNNDTITNNSQPNAFKSDKSNYETIFNHHRTRYLDREKQISFRFQPYYLSRRKSTNSMKNLGSSDSIYNDYDMLDFKERKEMVNDCKYDLNNKFQIDPGIIRC